MTYIEFFDHTAVENICACLVNPPERVVLIGDKGKLLQRHAQRYQELFANRGHRVEFIYRTVNKNNMQSILEALTELVEQYSDCAFGLTGGKELYLVAVGIISARYPQKNIQMHRFNIRSGTIIDCDQDGTTLLEEDKLQLSIVENVRIYGGDVVFDDVKENGTHIWDMNGEFKADIRAMWEVCKQDVRFWNTQIGILSNAEGLNEGEDALTTVVSLYRLRSQVGRSNPFFQEILEPLQAQGLLKLRPRSGDLMEITYKNLQVKKCLTKAGQVLEMFIYTAALDAKDKQGAPVYQDVLTGVSIDWDGDIHAQFQAFDTENEIDVMMMHGVVPVFVSCKNGMVEIDELYKISSVAERFGGRYAKKVLVATALDSKGTFDEYFRQRAKDMDIRLVEGVQTMDDQELNRVIGSFWSN